MHEHQEHHPWFSKPPRHKVQSPLEPITVRAALAQSVERFTRNEKVVGSIPTGGSTETPAQSACELGFLHALRRRGGGGFVQVVVFSVHVGVGLIGWEALALAASALQYMRRQAHS